MITENNTSSEILYREIENSDRERKKIPRYLQ